MKLNIQHTSKNVILMCSVFVVALKMPVAGWEDKIPSGISAAMHQTFL